eukprot:TRINITY_DN1626_c0_g1_i1.p1 TRINITY_DN1626_c0_g1~~TRINITY_DN1626_c0_g1_i1.p1  ORF type:complete len:284 (-),score=41.90 TRINITY_DN1626_c0_g1_i1:21-872(-)
MTTSKRALGKTKILCGGRCIVGPSWGTFLVTVFLISSLSLPHLFLIGVFYGFAWIAFYVIWIGIVFNFLFRAAFTDPGIIPRNTGETVKPIPPQKVTDPKDPNYIEFKYCQTCRIHRNSRAKHCRYCDNCVEKFDHHCPWIGTCVGARNYRFFIGFVLSTIFLCSVSVALSANDIGYLARISGMVQDLHPELQLRFIANCVLLAIILVIGISLIPLAIYHCKLIYLSQTTNENLRMVYETKKNPYDHGCAANCKETFLGDVPARSVVVHQKHVYFFTHFLWHK